MIPTFFIKQPFKILLPAALLIFGACKNGDLEHDAAGTFEATDAIVSAEVSGKILDFAVSEGDTVAKDKIVAHIDPTGFQLQKEQVAASMSALREKTADPAPQISILNQQIIAQKKQIAVQQEQLTVLQREQLRFQNLVKADAANTKQLDDINGQIAVIQKQIAAADSQIKVLEQQIAAQKQTAAIQNRGILSENEPLEKRLAQLDDQLQRAQVKNPIPGTVLVKYAEAGEVAGAGKPLYKIADLREIILRAYLTGSQLPAVKLGQKVRVFADDGSGGFKEYTGTISWIADKAEFTPKTIMTKDERANLVYAVKIKVPNDGSLKIGMYGEVGLGSEE